MSRNLLFALVFTLVVATASVFAKSEPPDELMYHIMQQRVVHDKTCTMQMHKNVECLVFSDDRQKMLWIVLFDTNTNITHVYALQGKTLSMVWVRDDLTT